MTPETKALYDKLRNATPYLMVIDSRRMNLAQGAVSYKMCSCCYTVIEHTWDHAAWCQLYHQEDLANWINQKK
jgi:hypothetical protein